MSRATREGRIDAVDFLKDAKSSRTPRSEIEQILLPDQETPDSGLIAALGRERTKRLFGVTESSFRKACAEYNESYFKVIREYLTIGEVAQ